MAERRSFETLNLLRGLAALTVLAWHFPGVDQARYWSAYLSVDLFFGLSGVVVAHAYERRLLEGWRFRRFVVARVIRLWPLYLLGSAIGAAATAAVVVHAGGARWMFKPLALDVVRATFLWPRITHAVEYPLNPPAWSLFAEFVVNLAYGAVLVRWPARRLGLVAAAAAVVVTIGAFEYQDVNVGLNIGALADHRWVGLARAFYSFPLGVLLYRAWRADRLPRFAVPPAACAGLFLLVLVAVPGEGRWAVPAGLAAIFVALPALVAAAMQVEPRGALRRVAKVTADLSYPIYATHAALYLAGETAVMVGHATSGPAAAVAIGTALILAPLADRLYDRPVRRVLTRLTTMPRGAPAAAAPL